MATFVLIHGVGDVGWYWPTCAPEASVEGTYGSYQRQSWPVGS